MMMIIAGKNGDFCGSQQTIFKAMDVVNRAIKRYENVEERKCFIDDLKENAEEKSTYLTAFSLIQMLYDLDEKQKNCYNYLINNLS